MLILSRNVGDSIRINDDITLTVLEVDGSQVRIGIKAPREVSVHREEIYHKVKAQEASGNPVESFMAHRPAYAPSPRSHH